MVKVVINVCYGGFGLSEAALRAYAKRKGLTLYPESSRLGSLIVTYWTAPPEARAGILSDDAWRHASVEERQESNRLYSKLVLYDRDIPRDDPDLVAVVEALGKDASDRFGNLKVVDVPDGVSWEIAEYDGMEHVSEQHGTWS